MKQGMTRKLAPKDKHSKASWKKRDEGRKGKQEAYTLETIAALAVKDAQMIEDLSGVLSPVDQAAIEALLAKIPS